MVAPALAPDHGNAIFVAMVDDSGTVVDLRIISASGGDGWPDALERATKLLKGKKLNLRGGGAAELRIAVVSDIKLPSGNKPGSPLTPGFTSSSFDITDLSAKPRRVVKARLLSLTTL